MEEKPVRKTTAKKTVRRVATKKVPARTVERKPAAAVTPARKAPSRVAPTVATRSKKNTKAVAIGSLLFTILLGVSALIGFSDKGEIDAAGKIAERKVNASTPEERASLEAVTDVNTQKPSTASTLVGMGSEGTVPVQEALPTTTPATTTVASSTEQTASSTQEVVSPESAQAATEETTVPEQVQNQ